MRRNFASLSLLPNRKSTPEMSNRSNVPMRTGKLPGELLSRLVSAYRTPSDPTVIVDPSYGYDAAAVSVGGEAIIVKSDPITFATSDAARYLIAVNANDVACMGGIPRWMTVVALLPETSTTTELVESLFADLQQACAEENISLIGGHTEITIGLDRPILVGTLLGTVGEHGLLYPGKAQVGDDLWLTQTAGIEGTALLAFERQEFLEPLIGAEMVSAAQGLLKDPGITISGDARALLASGAVTAMHDPTEGGVATAIHEIAGASGLGARVHAQAIPVSKETQAICDAFGLNPLGLLSSGAVLLATDPDKRADFEATAKGITPLTHIGSLTQAHDGIIDADSSPERALPRYDSDELASVLA